MYVYIYVYIYIYIYIEREREICTYIYKMLPLRPGGSGAPKAAGDGRAGHTAEPGGGAESCYYDYYYY